MAAPLEPLQAKEQRRQRQFQTPGEASLPNIDDDTISVIDPGANAVRRTLSVGDAPLAIALSGGAVWISHESGEVWRLADG